MVSTAARVGSINVLLSTQLGPGMAGLSAFANAVDRTGTTVSQRVAGMDRTISGLNSTLSRINSRGLAGVSVGALHAKTTLDQLRSAALAAGVAVGGLVPAAIVAGMIRTTDAAHRMSNQLRTVTEGSSDLKNTQDALFNVAQRTRSAFDSTVTIYARTARATEHLGLSQEKLLRITETVQKAFAVGGASAAEAQGAAIQLSQGIASNRFSGEEFRSVAENAPVLLRGMAESLGVNIGKLREMAHAGELTADVVTKAILEASRRIDEDFAKTTSTIEQAWVKVGNAVTKYTMDSQGASAASSSLVTILNALSANIDTVADSLLLLGTAALAVFGGRGGSTALAGVSSYISNLKAVRAETLANAAAMKKAATAEALLAATRARELRQNVVATSRGRKGELGELRNAMLAENAQKAAAAEAQFATAAQKAGDVRAAADAKAGAAKADATQKWAHFMAVARQEKKVAVESARAALVAAEAQKAATQTKLTGARAYYEMSKAAGVSQKTQIKAGKDLQKALQEDLKATNSIRVAQTNLQAALDGTAKKSRAYLAAQKAVETAKKQVATTTAAAAAAELKHTEAVAAHAVAQRATQAAITSGNLTKEQEAALNKRAEMLEKRVAAAKAQSAAATLAARDAARAATAATAQLAAAQQAASTRAMAFAAAGRAVSAAWSFIGGGFGAALLVLGGAMYVAGQRAAEAQDRSDRYADAIKKAGENSTGASPGIKQVAQDLFSVGAGATSAERAVSLANARMRETSGLDDMRRALEGALVAFGPLARVPLEVSQEIYRLAQEFRAGALSAEEFGGRLDVMARNHPNLSPLIADMQRFSKEVDAARGEVAGIADQIEKLDGKEAKITITIGTRTIELTDGGVGAKGDRPGASPMDKAAEDMRQNMLLLGRSGWDELFDFPKKKKERKPGAPKKTADNRFDNSLQSLQDRTAELVREREALNLSYAEQLRRQEALKLEQEALKYVREEARRKGETDWQNASLTPEQIEQINAKVDAHVREAMALKEARESQEAWAAAAGEAGSLIRGVIDGTMEWKDALLQLIPVVLKLMNSLNVAQGGKGIFGGGWMQSLIGGVLGISFHSGGTIGHGGTRTTLPIDAPFAGVFHGGGNFGGRPAKHDEVMALVQEHENIFTSSQTDGIIDALSASVSRLKARNVTAEVVVRGVFVDDNGVIKGQIVTMGQKAAQAGAAGAVDKVKRSLTGWQHQIARDGAVS